MITPDVLLTPAELDVRWHELNLGPLPYPLDVPSLGGTVEERARLRQDMVRYDPRVDDLLCLLADHEVAVDAVAQLDRTIRAVAVSNGRDAVLAVIDSDQVGLLEIRPTALARSIVSVLPDGEPGTGTALSVRLETLQDAVALHDDPPESEDPWGDEDLDERQALQKAGLSTQDSKLIAELAANRVAGGQFGVQRGPNRAGVLINWYDTHHGRYLMVHENGWLSLSPSDNDRIANRIATALAS